MTTLINSKELTEVILNNKGDVYQAIVRLVEKPLLEEILVICRGNQTKAAKALGLNRGTLRKRMKLHGMLR